MTDCRIPKFFYRGQPDDRFSFIFRHWGRELQAKEAYLHYLLVIVILLLVPAINLSSMTLSRMRKRMSEIGVRKAFGATANVLLRQVFYENLLFDAHSRSSRNAFQLCMYFFFIE